MRVVKQISSLEKVRNQSSMDYTRLNKKTLLKGERFSYQICARTSMYNDLTENVTGKIEVCSPLSDYIKVFYVENAVMDKPVTVPNALSEVDYITTTPGLMPDILVPATENDGIWDINTNAKSLWIELCVPENIENGEYDINIKLRKIKDGTIDLLDEFVFDEKLTVEILDERMSPQQLIYTRWFYVDSISDYYNVEVYSEEHWALIEEYLKAAVDSGVNMILVPVHTPPLDTAINHKRTCVQLVDIKKDGNTYTFGFDKFHRFVELCKKCGVQYFEIAHMFSQWGAKCSPNIVVEENGVKDYLFSWDVKADSDEYIEFLGQYIAAIHEQLKKAGIEEKTYFHISDEPNLNSIDTYKRASDIITPLIGDSKTFDALSLYEFYEKGLVKCPVTGIGHMKDFIGKEVPNQWTYYCCFPQHVYSNSIMAMPLSRLRIIGYLLYKYDIKGFLHWGFNFFGGCLSRYAINPYVTTSAAGIFPSGDPFIVYPSKDGAYPSMRGKTMYDAISDLRLCQTLEKYIGRDKVCELIDEYAGGELTFEIYPTGKEYIETLNDKMKEIIKSKTAK